MNSAAIAVRVPDLADVLTPGLGVDPKEFAAWLLEPLTRYHLDEWFRAHRPARKDELGALTALDKSLRKVCMHLGPGGVPPVADALINESLYRSRGEWLPELNERVLADLCRLLALIEQARKAIRQAGPQRAGRRPAGPRDRLLKDVVSRLRACGLKAEQARELAELVLVRCKVPVPSADTSIRRAARRAEAGVQK